MNTSIGNLCIFNKWVILVCDDQIGAMYRSLYNLEYFYKPKIQKPLWGTHISIIRGETVLDEKFKFLDGSRIFFQYLSEMHTNGIHFYLPVVCPVLDKIKNIFGLGLTQVNYHMSIGNIRDETGWREPEVYS